MGGGKGSSSAPPPIDQGKSMGEYMFGKGFTSYQGITDPRLQDRLSVQKLRIDHNTQH
jgi:hypothetical protein